MKYLIIAFIGYIVFQEVCPLFAAHVVELPALPAGDLPNSEVVTNIMLDDNIENFDRISLEISLVSSPSNSVSVALGVASGEKLALEEEDFEWGYDCGTWFYSDTATGGVQYEQENAMGRISHAIEIPRCQFNFGWNMISIVKRGVGDIQAEIFLIGESRRFLNKVR